jgi:hypothetical protein
MYTYIYRGEAIAVEKREQMENQLSAALHALARVEQASSLRPHTLVA